MRRAFLLSLGLTTTLAFAGPADDVARAREAFVAGQKLYASGKFAEALKRFEASFALKPHPATVFNIARCLDRTGELVRAMTAYKEYLRLAPTATDADEVTNAIASIEGRLQAKGLQHVLVYTEPATADVAIDGRPIGSGSPVAAALAPGPHTVVITAPGYERFERSVALSATRSLELTVALSAAPAAKVTAPPPDVPPAEAPGPKVATTPADPPPPSAPAKEVASPTTASSAPPTAEPNRVDPPGVSAAAAPAPRRRPFTWVTAGLAVAATGASIGTFVAMRWYESQLTRFDPNRGRATATLLYNEAITYGGWSTAFAITAAVSAGIALLLFFVEGR